MSSLQPQIQNMGETIFKMMEGEGKSIFNKDWWYGKVMEWSMSNEHFKTQMFRFVDVLPYLNSGSEVTRHLKEYFAEGGQEIPSIFNVGLGIGSFAPSLVSAAVVKNVTQMAKMFIVGENPQEALPILKKARKNQICFTVDLLGEATLSEKEANEYSSKYCELIEWLARDAQKWDEQTLIDRDQRGPIPKVNVSVKLSSLYSQISEKDWDTTVTILKDRLRPLFKIAKENFVFINLDMEQYSLKNMTLQVFKELIMEPEFKDYRHWGIVIQAYLRDSYQDVQGLVAFAQERKVPFTIRLVKGAYWEYETVHARQKGWPIPVYTNKQESDANYEKCAQLILMNWQVLQLALGSHNVRSISSAIVFAEHHKVPKEAFEVQMLFGMADPIKRSLVRMGYRVREYAPIGELIPGMAYLVRRLLENSSNESFLRAKFAENMSTEVLLRDPNEGLRPSPAIESNPDLFYNMAPLDFTHHQHRTAIAAALNQSKKQGVMEIPIVIDNQKIKSSRQESSLNPSHPDEVVAQFALATEADAERSVESCKKAGLAWRKTPPIERAKLIDRVADLIEQNKFELIALEIREVGKTWAEADGDIAEAVDFCRYYAREMRRLAKPQRVGHAEGEVSLYHYQPRGIALVISPWNFPLAILTGQVVAALVTGNTVIMKPAEQSTAIAYKLMEYLMQAGLPAGTVNFVPGLGEEVGEYLTGHKDVDIISFTGSKAVGLHILKKAGMTLPGQKSVKKCIIEMGGKNAIIVDSDADLDEAIQGVLYSAFGFQGQKCSACSRVIVLEDNYDRFLDRLLESAKAIPNGFAEHAKTFLGPVIDKEAQERILRTIEEAKKEATLVYQSEVPREGYFVPLTIFKDVDPKSRLAQQEIFGPVLAIIKAKDLDHALNIANDVEYALTGGLYSRSPANIERVKWDFEVGNLYINRGITGALVERHPFGGFKMSGVGSKTGGPDYLLQYLEPRVVTENTMRRGFAPTEKTDQ